MASRLRRTTVLIAIAAATSIAAAQQPPRDPPPPRSPAVPRNGTAAISGQVVLSSGEPVKGAEVQITSVRGRTTASTDENGRFEFTALPAGAYFLYATRPDLLSVRYGEQIYNRGGRAIPLAAGEHRDFRLTLPRRSTIAGTVTDANGHPLAKATVNLVKLMPPALYGYPAAFHWGSVTTDASGKYQLASIDPADYAVCVSTVDMLSRNTAIGFAPACYSSAGESPQKIALAPEETRTGVNVTLQQTPLRRVEGTLNLPSDAPVPAVIELRNVNELYAEPRPVARPDRDRRFRFTNVTPGHYVLRAQAGAETDRWGALQDLVIEDTDIDDIVLRFAHGSRVAGRIEFRGTTPPSQAAKRPRLLLGAAVPGPGSLHWGAYEGTVDATGAFVFPSVLPGRYKLSALYSGTDNWYADNPPDDIIDVHEGANVGGVVLRVADYRAQLTGTIVTTRGTPASEYVIVVYPANPQEWGAPSDFGRAHLDGTFTLRLKHPGTYRVGTILDYNPAVRIGADVLRDIDRTAMTVAVKEGETKTISIVVPDGR